MIKPTKDYEMIKKMIIEDKELFDRISDDYTDINTINLKSSEWIGYFEDDICKALMSITKENSIVLNIHIHIPSKNRGKDSFKIGNSLLKYVESNADKRYIKINAKIPDLYVDVVRFAMKNGFEVEGVDRMSIMKNGKAHDRLMLGKIIER